MDNSFLTYASDILAETDSGLTGSKIISYFTGYAVDFNKSLTYDNYPFHSSKMVSKRQAFKSNLLCFSEEQQYKIIMELASLPTFRENESAHDLKMKLIERYGYLSTSKLEDSELIINTRHWLEDYPTSLNFYNAALLKYENGFEYRNSLDEMRLAFETLLKEVLGNNKSLENQLNELGRLLKSSGITPELRNTITTLIDYYTKFQNQHIKHTREIVTNEIEAEVIIELTSILMKFIIKNHVEINL
nr:hypothetical protein [uncultured Trichococcus sp.]